MFNTGRNNQIKILVTLKKKSILVGRKVSVIGKNVSVAVRGIKKKTIPISLSHLTNSHNQRGGGGYTVYGCLYDQLLPCKGHATKQRYP